MKIRTRLLLFLLPTLTLGITLIATLIAYNWYHFIENIKAGVSLIQVQENLSDSLFIVFLGASLTITIMLVTLFIIANKISNPIQKLNNSALGIAAGDYEEPITIAGPKEITELANTLNIMRECLLENINRLKENSRLREKMYGEYECSILLQHLMLQKNIDDCRSDAVAIKAISFFSENPKGILLSLPKKNHLDRFDLHLTEASQEGFEGMYQLLSQNKNASSSTHLFLDRFASVLHINEKSCVPFVWSFNKKQFLPLTNSQVAVESGDFFFLYNQGFFNHYKNPQQITNFLARVLKIFAQDGLETMTSMLQKEIAFSMKRKEMIEDIHLLCFQILT